MIGSDKAMRVTGEYLAKAAAFEAMADFENDPVDKERYAAVAENYRRLARERQWALAKRAIERMPYQEPPPRPRRNEQPHAAACGSGSVPFVRPVSAGS